MTQFNKGNTYEEIITFTILEFENKEATSKNVAMCQKIIYTNQRHLTKTVTPVIEFTDQPVIECDVPVVKKCFCR